MLVSKGFFTLGTSIIHLFKALMFTLMLSKKQSIDIFPTTLIYYVYKNSWN